MLKLFLVVLTVAPIFGSSEFQCPGEGTFPDPTDCSSYYVCTQTEKVKMHCPKDTAFDPILKICQYTNNVNCFQSSTTTEKLTTTTTTKRPTITTTTKRPSSTSTTTESGVPKCPEAGIHFIENPADCATFFVCVEGHYALNTCPSGYGFDAKTEDCVLADLVGCSSHSSTPPTPDTPITCPPKGLQPYPNPSDCSTFYLCQNGNLDIITCPVGYHFDTIDTRCEEIKSAKCDGQVTSSSIKPHTTEKPNYNCDGHPNGSTFPDPSDCTKYFQCSNGHVVGNTCSPGLEFNDQLHVCDDPSNANCHVH